MAIPAIIAANPELSAFIASQGLRLLGGFFDSKDEKKFLKKLKKAQAQANLVSVLTQGRVNPVVNEQFAPNKLSRALNLAATAIDLGTQVSSLVNQKKLQKLQVKGAELSYAKALQDSATTAGDLFAASNYAKLREIQYAPEEVWTPEQKRLGQELLENAAKFGEDGEIFRQTVRGAVERIRKENELYKLETSFKDAQTRYINAQTQGLLNEADLQPYKLEVQRLKAEAELAKTQFDAERQRRQDQLQQQSNNINVAKLRGEAEDKVNESLDLKGYKQFLLNAKGVVDIIKPALAENRTISRVEQLALANRYISFVDQPGVAAREADIENLRTAGLSLIKRIQQAGQNIDTDIVLNKSTVKELYDLVGKLSKVRQESLAQQISDFSPGLIASYGTVLGGPQWFADTVGSTVEGYNQLIDDFIIPDPKQVQRRANTQLRINNLFPDSLKVEPQSFNPQEEKKLDVTNLSSPFDFIPNTVARFGASAINKVLAPTEAEIDQGIVEGKYKPTTSTFLQNLPSSYTTALQNLSPLNGLARSVNPLASLYQPVQPSQDYENFKRSVAGRRRYVG